MIVHKPSSPVLTLASALPMMVVMVSTLIGCGSGRLGRVPPGFQGERDAGVAVIGADFALSSNTTVSTTQPVHFTIKSNKEPRGHEVYPDYRAYLHPQAAPGVRSMIGVTFTEPVVIVPDGWAYLVGRYPAGRTGRIRAIGWGTEMVIEIDNSGGAEVHRVYFISGEARIDIYVPWDRIDPVYTMETPGAYVESAAANAWEFKGPYSAVAERAAFIKNVLGEIHSEGVK